MNSLRGNRKGENNVKTPLALRACLLARRRRCRSRCRNVICIPDAPGRRSSPSQRQPEHPDRMLYRT